MLGEISEDGELLPRDEAEGLNWLRKAAGQGDSSAQRDLGERYLSGTPEGVKWLRRYCESACESAVADPRFGAFVGMQCAVLAGYYESGRAVPKDQAEAIRWYRKAAELGDSVGQQRLARISQSGQGTAKDPFDASNWYQLGTAYEEGRGAPKDPAEAARCYRKAADEGPGGGDRYQVLSQIALGKLYAEGRGVRLDGFEAIKWYQKAADGGSVDALVGIAEVWSFGKGVPENTSEAVKWYKQAAQKGNAVSKFNLGVFYSKGEGMPLDYVEAYKWYNLAAANGYGKATELRNSLALLMTREQIAAAQQRASDFLAKKQLDSGRSIGGNSTAPDSSSPDPKASGSGFFITEDGYLLTNAHVVDEATRLTVRTSLGTFPASLVKADSVNDIAVLKVPGRFHPMSIIPSRTVKLGDVVFTIGFPNPQLQGIEPKLTDGKISSLAGAQDDARQFQISVAVQPGNSGGALVNATGNVVGIVAARLSDSAALKTSGALPQNVNYAIKSSYVLSLLESLPEVVNKLKEPCSAKERKFEDVVKEVEDATVLVMVY
jgi:TPR repeat protein